MCDLAKPGWRACLSAEAAAALSFSGLIADFRRVSWQVRRARQTPRWLQWHFRLGAGRSQHSVRRAFLLNGTVLPEKPFSSERVAGAIASRTLECVCPDSWVGRGLSCPHSKGQRCQRFPPGCVLENCVSITSNRDRHSCWETDVFPNHRLRSVPKRGCHRWKNFAFLCKNFLKCQCSPAPGRRLSKKPIRGSSWLFVSFKPLCLPSKVKQRSRHRVTFPQSLGKKKSKQQAVE